MRRGNRSLPLTPLVLSLLPHIQKALQSSQKPIGTLMLVLICFIFFFSPESIVDAYSGGLIPRDIVEQGILRMSLRSLGRIISSGFIHADEVHLYYNMVSLISKGISLEPRFGTYGFLLLSVALLTCSHTLYVFVAYILSKHFHHHSLYNSTAVGISALLFAFKVLANSRSILPNAPTTVIFMGMSFPAPLLAWAELVLISLVTPNASFTGHLCGIISAVGFLTLYNHPLWLVLAGILHRTPTRRDQPSSRRLMGGRFQESAAYSREMRLLREMGFVDSERNRLALEFCHGKLDDAITFLTRRD